MPGEGLVHPRTGRDEEAALARERGPLAHDRIHGRVHDQVHRWAQEQAPHWAPDADGDLAPSPIPCVDHRPLQTPIRNQGDRATCLSFASLACLEAILKEHFGKEIDLSEQFLQFVLTGDHCAEAVDLPAAPAKLAGRGVCEESLAPYELRAAASLHRSRPPSADAFRRAFYKIGTFHLLENRGPSGPSIANTDYLERLLQAGHDIVTALRIAAGVRGGDGILDVRYGPSGEPLRGNGAHALLLVGYDRRDPSRPHFLFKDSLGVPRSGGRDGYHRLPYDYVRAYALSGFLVESLEIAGPPFGPMVVRVHAGGCCEAVH